MDLFGNTLKETHNYSNGGFGGARQSVTEYERNVHGQVRRTTGTYIVGQTAAPLVTDYTYDALRRLMTVLYPDATMETWVFNAAGLTGPHQPGTYTNRVGHKTTYGYTSGQQTSAIVRNAVNVFMYETQMTWSGMMVTSTTLPSVNGGASGDTSRPASKYFYDSRGRLIHQRRTSAEALNGTPLATDIWSSQGYNALGNIAFVTSEYSNPALDGNGLPTGLGDTLKTEFLTTALGDVRRMTQRDPDGAGSLVRPVYDFSLDAQGRVLTSIEPGPGTVAERTTTIDWNDFGELATTVRPDPDGGTGALLGTTMTYTYDLLGFPISVKTAATGGAIVKSEFFKFNSRGELEWQSLPYGADKTAADAADRTLFNYDAFSRMVRQEVQSGLAGTSDYQVTLWDYDDLNRKMTVTDAANSDWKTYFDALGRITKTETPDPDDGGANILLTTVIDYFDGNTTYGIVGTYARVIDPRGHVSWTKFSPSGQILLDEPGDPDGAGATPEKWTRYVYDAFDRLDMMGERYGATYATALSTERITDYNYNSRSQLTYLISPDPDIVGGGLLTPLTTVYAYDNLGRSTSVTTPSGLVTNSVWRVDGVLTNESRVDNDGNAVNDWTVAYNYDNWDRIVSMVTPQSLAGAGLATTSYAYNQRGDLASKTAPDPDGSGTGLPSVMTYGYDSVNAGIFVNSVTTSASVGTATTALVYDRAGRLREQKRPDPVTGSPVAYATEKWTYDALDRLTSALVVKPQSGTTSETATYDALNYAYDRLSRLKQVDDGNLNRAELTTYRNDGDVHQTTDALGRVVEYAYDKWGRVTDTKRLLNNAVYDTTNTRYDGFGRGPGSRGLGSRGRITGRDHGASHLLT